MKVYITGLECLPGDQANTKIQETKEFLSLIDIDAVSITNSDLKSSIIEATTLLLSCDGILLLDNWVNSSISRILRTVSEELGKSILFESIINDRSDENRIIKTVCSVIGVSMDDVRSECRRTEFFFARMAIAILCNKHTSLNKSQIAQLIGKNRTMLSHYKSMYENEVRYNPRFRSIMYKIEKLLNTNVSE